jgi:hypothetical protein
MALGSIPGWCTLFVSLLAQWRFGLLVAFRDYRVEDIYALRTLICVGNNHVCIRVLVDFFIHDARKSAFVVLRTRELALPQTTRDVLLVGFL